MSLVSVITPFLDPNPDFFEEAIAGVFAQSHQDWELLLVDDGSGDAAREFAVRMANKHPGKIRYLHHPNHANRGASATRNLGIEHSQGKYIAFLDADDVWLPRKLEEQVCGLDRNPDAAMLFGDTLYWYSWTGQTEHKRRDFYVKLGVPAPCSIEAPKYLELSLNGLVSVPCMSDVIVRGQGAQSVGGFEDSFRSFYDDQVFFAKIWLRLPILVMPDHWNLYRQHPESMCALEGGAQNREVHRGAYLDWLAEYIQKIEFCDAPVRRALNQQRLVSRVSRRARLPGRMLRLSLKALEAVRRCGAR
jgi:glycosyltransferase involved in cell wall biosynthesis